MTLTLTAYAYVKAYGKVVKNFGEFMYLVEKFGLPRVIEMAISDLKREQRRFRRMFGVEVDFSDEIKELEKLRERFLGLRREIDWVVS